MEFAKTEKFTARVSDKYFVSDNEKFLYIRFELVLPDRIEFRAGQYVSIKISELGERRSYSMASTPDNNHGFHLLVEMINGGKGSEYLMSLKLGDVVEVLAPLGRFVVEESKLTNQQTNEPTKFLFVATGSGIVPVYSMINDLLINKRETKQTRLHWGMRSERDIFWFDNFERLMENYPNFVFDPVLSAGSDDWELCRGHVQDCLSRDFPLTGSGLKGWQGYVCGNSTMVEQVTQKLIDLGMKADLIHGEKFV